ncbi:type II toxin-antitoxin system RelE/ParE family toxin [Solimicrobium silvestre]|uniref:Plasmid stabilization system protein n=1 Tax=Solimicrobium silvestre TaxID=2099400 RepID=A0A2S9H0C6_9BURK|nr:type II toxin-antitoxin system RelE/ParE family toxin [Solimicrobium silvestre]PRC93435.1 Plasmid stabilization system protein [Solimicrobium silvestre]
MKRVKRTQTYLDDLNAIEAHITVQDSPQAAADLWLHIDGQVDLLADPNHPRRKGLVVPDAIELVAHPNYLVILDEDETTVAVLNVLHVKRKHPR